MKKFKLKSPRYSFDHEGMIINGKLRSCEHEVDVRARDLCENNMDIMSKRNVIQCMIEGNDYTWRYELDELEPLETFKMTRLDYEMLKFVQKQGAKYICRDESGLLNLYDSVPRISGDNHTWTSIGNSDYLSNFTNKLFQFVKWESQKYYVIKDVLNNCEVIDDD